MATTQIATESKRPSLSQNIEALYANLHAGGAFDVKTDVIVNGSHNLRASSLQSQTHTPKGFKTKMQEQQTELYMGRDSTMVTTRMRTSVYGDHSSVRYQR